MCNSFKDGTVKTNFIIYFVSRLISDLGSSVFSFALSLYVLDITGSAALFTIIVGFSYLPKTIVSIVAGVYVDKHDKKKLVILFDFMSGIVTLIFWIIFKAYTKSIPFITGFQIVLSALVGMFVLALNSSIPNLSTKENIVKFNSMSMGITAIVSMGGPVIGAIAYKAFGIFGVTFIDGITFFISGTMEVFLKYNKTVANRDGKGYFESFHTVWTYLNGEKVFSIYSNSISYDYPMVYF
ncbi:MFS transporter [Clostridium hydrogenum]|uniref:MFS transporter n=1 Tax=Clostridium hydrogenum TaxID=2855764 RepID=UPI001F32528F|nr:MFS transporter [Clostridium hydrogenum]